MKIKIKYKGHTVFVEEDYKFTSYIDVKNVITNIIKESIKTLGENHETA